MCKVATGNTLKANFFFFSIWKCNNDEYICPILKIFHFTGKNTYYEQS
jgi:hypothetical protein